MAPAAASPAQRVVGVILAGGEGRRLGGGGKALRPLAGRPLAAHVADRVAPQVAALAINANGDPAAFAALRLAVLPDPVADRPGPLAGVLAGLAWAGTEAPSRAAWLLTVPCDAPLLPADLVARLLAAAGEGDTAAEVACARSGGRLHPVCALWRPVLLPAVAAALAAGRREVEAFVRARRLAVADFAGDPDPFLNVNTAEDLARAAAALGAVRA